MIINIGLSILSGIFWRMGGAKDYSKLWRRLGSTACMAVIIFEPRWFFLASLALLYWGSTSYFGWLTPGDPKERWFNYLSAALITQIAGAFMTGGYIHALIFAAAGAIGKVLIDKLPLKGKDVMSEFYYGFMMCLGLAIQQL